MPVLSTLGAMAARGFGFLGKVAQAVDEYFEYVTLLLPGNGTNGAQNNTFLDSSTNNFTITRNGNTTQGTFAPYGSNWSNYFDGTGDYLTAPSNAAFAFGTGDFAIEAWVYPQGTQFYNTIAATNSSGSLQAGRWWFEFSQTRGFAFITGSATYSQVATVVLDQWQHIAVTRSGSTLRFFLNGVQQGTNQTVSDDLNTTTTCGIGALAAGGQPFTGYISNIRIVKGSAVYTSAFTPPTAPLTAITNTSLLTCQSNRFIDNSTNAFAITKNGDVSVQVFSPFSPTASYAAGAIGGSGYFDGTGDYLNTPATGQFAPTGDFTIAVWYYPTTLSTNNIVIANYTADLTTDWQINVTSTGSVEFYTNGNPIRISGGSVRAGAWNYIVLARSGSTLTGYLNGTSIGTYTQSGTFGSATKTIWVGSRPFSGSPLPITGYISDVKLIDGSAVTTVPTAPQTATTGTNLLLSFTNAGVIDNAMMNDLETVGNAQISTTQSKWGGSSIAFDGTGDYLSTPYNQNIMPGAGDFTLECWARISYVASSAIITSTNTTITTASWLLGFSNTTNEMAFAINSSGVAIVGADYSSYLDTWTHIAVSRSGSTLRLFFNGTQAASVTNTTNFTGDSANPVFFGRRYTNQALYDLNGYIDDLRITKGYARYTANFTAPTAPFPTR